jgi:hypothetical protein
LVPTTACVLGSSTLCFWLLDVLGRGISYEKLLRDSARCLTRSCSEYTMLLYALQKDSARALGANAWDRSSVMTALAVAGSALTAVSAGGWMLCGEKGNGTHVLSAHVREESHFSPTLCSVSLTSVGQPTPNFAAPTCTGGVQEACCLRERKVCAVLVILAIIEMTAFFRPVRPLVSSLRHLRRRRQSLQVAGADVAATRAMGDDVHVDEKKQWCVTVGKLCQVLVAVYAHRMRCSVPQAGWLLPVLCAQVSTRLVKPPPPFRPS